MGAMASQITSLTIVYSIVYSGADQRKHQSSALLAFVWGIHRWPVNSRHKWPVTRKMFPFDDVMMNASILVWASGPCSGCWEITSSNGNIFRVTGPLGTLIPAWISNYILSKVWDKITYPLQNFGGWNNEVCEWIGNFIALFAGHVITYTCWDLS